MKRLTDLRRRLHTLDMLGEAVGAMKSLSAHHFREARRALEPARAYREGVERIAARVGASLPAGEGAVGLLVVGAELGLCGAYNARIAEAAVAHRRELGDGPTLCVGHRAASLLARRDLTLDAVYSGAASVRGIPELLLRLAEDMLTRYVTAGLSAFDVVAARFEGVGSHPAVITRLLPVQAPPPREAAPAPRYATPDYMRAAAVRELLYTTMHELLLDAIAAEHGARLFATQSAEAWLDERSEAVQRTLASGKREAQTQEMLEIVGGAHAAYRAG